MPETLRRELIYFWYYFSIQFDQIVWYWIFGMALGSLVSVFGKEKIHNLFVKMRNTKIGAAGQNVATKNRIKAVGRLRFFVARAAVGGEA
jgi:uncharacterized membrane protein YraQ (UPF0718 family)